MSKHFNFILKKEFFVLFFVVVIVVIVVYSYLNLNLTYYEIKKI